MNQPDHAYSPTKAYSDRINSSDFVSLSNTFVSSIIFLVDKFVLNNGGAGKSLRKSNISYSEFLNMPSPTENNILLN